MATTAETDAQLSLFAEDDLLGGVAPDAPPEEATLPPIGREQLAATAARPLPTGYAAPRVATRRPPASTLRQVNPADMVPGEAVPLIWLATGDEAHPYPETLPSDVWLWITDHPEKRYRFVGWQYFGRTDSVVIHDPTGEPGTHNTAPVKVMMICRLPDTQPAAQPEPELLDDAPDELL